METVPKIYSFLASGSFKDLKAGIEKTSFNMEETIFLGCNISALDQNVVEMTISKGRVGESPKTYTERCKLKPYTSALFYTTYIPDDDDIGDWSISIFVTDSKGNISNTVTTTVIITDKV
jgi:hypothetical protein